MVRCFYLVVCLALVFTGCSALNDGKLTDLDGETLITSKNFDKITQMQWQLEKITKDGKDIPPIGERPFIKFEEEGRFSGFTGINRFFGSMKIDSQGNLKLAQVGATKMAGPEQEMRQEFMFLDLFPRIERLRMEGIYLYGLTKDKQAELKFYVPVN
jgi:heat shock protein HslJ